MRNMRHYYVFALLVAAVPGFAAVPTDNPLTPYKVSWAEKLNWSRTVDIATVAGATADEKLAAAQKQLGAEGGVIFFPAGVYQFKEHITLQNNIILRGETPKQTDARKDDYAPATRFEFPKYEPTFEGDGTANETAFKGFRVADPATTSNVGLVNIAINRGHINFDETRTHEAGRNRFVVGCTLMNTAVPDEKVPSRSIGQHGWQRYPGWKHSAIRLYTAENALVANNRLNPSTDSFMMKGYVVQKNPRFGKDTEARDVLFDHDNRGGITVNGYSLGGAGGQDPKGTPETHPWGFRKGIVIVNNYVFLTGRTAIHFTGDGTIASFNVIQMKPGVQRITNTGIGTTSGSSTNDNRAMTIRGWRYTVEGNDYEVYRNLSSDGTYYINDGEGLMHEGHANCVIKDSKIINNKGNAYLSVFLTAGIDGLLVEGNDIRPKGPGTDTKISSIFVVSDRNWDRHYLRNVRIINNTTAGSGIAITGAPAEGNVVKGNKHIGDMPGSITNGAEAVVEDNENYTVKVPTIDKPLADPNRPSATQPATRARP